MGWRSITVRCVRRIRQALVGTDAVQKELGNSRLLPSMPVGITNSGTRAPSRLRA